ncbi:MAG: NF038129 family PEP-CTERM protein [Methylococcaceae bacterium]
MKIQYTTITRQHDLKYRRRKCGFISSTFLSLFLAFVGITGCFQNAYAFSFTFDTSALAGTTATLDFSLFDGDLAVNNAVTISNFSGGGLISADCSVSCSSTASGYVIDDSSSMFGQLLQTLTLGTLLSFELNPTANFAGGAPDRMILWLLDPNTNFTLIDTNLDLLSDAIPYEDALLVINFGAGGVTVQQAGTRIPEPDTLLLMLLGLSLMLMGKLRLPVFIRDLQIPLFKLSS